MDMEPIRGEYHTIVFGDPIVIYLTDGMVPVHPPEVVAEYEAAQARREGGNAAAPIDVDGLDAAAVPDRPRTDVGALPSFAVQRAAERAERQASAAAARAARRAADDAVTDSVAGVGPLPAVMAVRHLPCDGCLRASVINPGVVCLPATTQSCVRCRSFSQSCVTSLGLDLFDQVRRIAVSPLSPLHRFAVGYADSVTS